MEEPLITKDQIQKPQQGISTLTGILIALLAAVIAGAGVWAYYTYKVIPDLEKQPTTAVYSKPATPTSTPTTTDETANWKTLSNDVCNFSIKYPNDWILDKNTNANFPEFFLNSPENEKIKEEIQSKPPYYSDEYGPDFIISCYNNLEKLTSGDIQTKNAKNLNEYLVAEEKASVLSNRKQIIFGNKQAWEYILHGMGDYYAIAVENKGKYIIISSGTTENKSKLTIEQQKILSTFQFTK